MVYKLVYRQARTDNRGFVQYTANLNEEQMKIRTDYVTLLDNLAEEFNTKRVTVTSNNIAITSYDFETEEAARQFRIRSKEIQDATGWSQLMFVRNKSVVANTGITKSSILLYKDDELIDNLLHVTWDKY